MSIEGFNNLNLFESSQGEIIESGETQLTAALDEKQAAEGQSEEQSSEEKVEAPKVEVKPEEDKFAAKFAALSRREKELRAEKQQIESMRAEVDKLKAELQSNKVQEPAKVPLDKLLRTNPLEALKEAGWDFEKLTRLQLEDGKMPIDIQLKLQRQELEEQFKNEISELKKQVDEKSKKDEDEKYNSVINNFKSELDSFINTNSEKYELIKANDATDMVFDVIEDYYNQTGRVLDKTEAADQVEQYLDEELNKVLKASKKYSSATQNVSKPNNVKTLSPTLSNTQSAQGVQEKAESMLSDEESKRKAASVIRWDA